MQKLGSKALVKRMNRAAVLNAVRERGQIGRAEIADLTHISRASVTYIVAELLEEGWLIEQEKGQTTPSGGRPPILLQFNPDSVYAVVVMLGSERTAVSLGNADAAALYTHSVPARPEAGAAETVEIVSALIERALKESRVDRERVRGVVIGVPGLVDSLNSVVHYSARLPGLRNVDLGAQVQARVKLPVAVENETRLIGWGEQKFGHGQGRSPLVCVNITLGIGSCVILEDRMLFGSSYSAGQFGHMTVDADGSLCECGNRGCWETLASNAALLERARRAGAPWSENPSVEGILEASARGDARARALLRETATHIGVGIANIINIVNPEVIVLHGKVFGAGEELLRGVRHVVADRALKLPALNAQIVISDLGERAGLAGGVSLVVRRTLEAPLVRRENDLYL
ncbi:putative NBD/HSP70 family sugar kinase [Deinobacterium chartae]|uniref:Putative NBD/HSP70 family sugar kinase n=1 Tax=Deinobacterium chartae TaxID=521158 RepID=A0A841HX47_9DEIO|nr:putative NBD/HSP70 family sugar kinase [Deinobacterium chartae]